MRYTRDEVIRLPVAHGFGRYVKVGDKVRVVFKYLEDVNGSDERIAGIASENGRILGMMPHPERACESILGGTDGLRLFQSIVEFIRRELH